MQHRLHDPEEADNANDPGYHRPDSESLMNQNPQGESGAKHDSYDSTAAALSEKCRHDERKHNTGDRPSAAPSDFVHQQNSQRWQKVAKIAEVIPESIPAAELTASP